MRYIKLTAELLDETVEVEMEHCGDDGLSVKVTQTIKGHNPIVYEGFVSQE
jgi:hypothetical protein